jgi:acetolactate synthase-1/2/3 large subunit
MILAGGGVVRAGASEELRVFAEKIGAQVACTLMGIGGMPYSHPLYTGNIGMHGSLVSNRAINETDLLIVLGGRFSDRVVGKESGFAAKAKLLHIDIDPAEINKNVLVHESIHGDIKVVLEELISKVSQKQNEPWNIYVNHLRETVGHKTDNSTLNVPYLLKEIAKYANKDTIVATDVGQHQMWTAQHFPFERPNRFLTSGGLGTMGYGLGAAIGAQFANPKERVIMITGDGSFRMNFNEIITAVKHKLPIKIFVMNNRALGMVRQWQNLFYDNRFSSTTLEDDMDYVGFAKSLGGVGFNILTTDDIEPVLKEVFASSKPVVVNCVVDQNTNVYPMVTPGKSIYEAISE